MRQRGQMGCPNWMRFTRDARGERPFKKNFTSDLRRVTNGHFAKKFRWKVEPAAIGHNSSRPTMRRRPRCQPGVGHPPEFRHGDDSRCDAGAGYADVIAPASTRRTPRPCRPRRRLAANHPQRHPHPGDNWLCRFFASSGTMDAMTTPPRSFWTDLAADLADPTFRAAYLDAVEHLVTVDQCATEHPAPPRCDECSGSENKGG